MIELEAPLIAGVVRPGQFIMIASGGQDTILPRPFSIFGVSPDRQRLKLLFAVKGSGTAWLAGCRPGDRARVLGPLGNGFKVEQGWHDLLLVAGGLGVAPLAYLAAEQAGKCRVTLVAGATVEAGLLPHTELPTGITYLTATDDGSAGHKGQVTVLASEFAQGADSIFGCGPLGMLHSMSSAYWLARKLVQISLEVRMGCGTGLCFGCTILTTGGPKRVCRDGPVFPLDSVCWDSVRC